MAGNPMARNGMLEKRKDIFIVLMARWLVLMVTGHSYAIGEDKCEDSHPHPVWGPYLLAMPLRVRLQVGWGAKKD